MKRRKHLAKAVVCHALNLITAYGFYMCASDPVQAAEKKTYTRMPFAAFSSQMNDELLGSDKYEKPVWNLHDALKLPEWLSASVEQRTRYETVGGPFKANSKGGDQQIALQTTLWLEAHMRSFRFGTEFMDARGLNSDSGTGMNNTMSNSWDFLQAYGAWAGQNIFYSGIGAEVVAGRQTLNLGMRRLVARNAMRNSINSFTGLKLRLLDYGNWQFTGFVTAPVNRLPTSSTALLDNDQVFDRENTHTWFSGGFMEFFDLGWGINNEVYLYHIDEGSSTSAPSRHRRYFTPGTRFFIKPVKAAIDFQLETIGQFGTVQAATAANSKNLNHTAWYQHADVGYTIDMPWSPHLTVEYDYASGDQNPLDNKDQRFDTLYGARRFEFGLST